MKALLGFVLLAIVLRLMAYWWKIAKKAREELKSMEEDENNIKNDKTNPS